MFALSRNASKAYSTVSVETGVAEADPVKLVVMLYDGAVLALASARMAIERNDIAAKGHNISRAIEIIESGLKASLDFESGGELAERLAALYDYMSSRLLYANLHSNSAALDEVMNLLNDLKGAWESIQTAAAA
jgi:flagellar protein FliS